MSEFIVDLKLLKIFCLSSIISILSFLVILTFMRKSFDGVYFYIGKSLLQIVFVFYLLGTEPILINNLKRVLNKEEELLES